MKRHLTPKERRTLSTRSALKRKNYGKVRMCVFRSNSHIEIQAIDDVKGLTLASASSRTKGFKGKGWNINGAEMVGADFAVNCKKAGLKDVYFDRGGYRYHGRVKALADAVRAGGIKF